MFNLVVTNIPGPQHPLYMLGRELDTMFPMVPLAENTALGIAILSYNGQLNFGLVTDFDALADVEALADSMRASIDETVSAARASSATGNGARRRKPRQRALRAAE
jgi:hypothetical protein